MIRRFLAGLLSAIFVLVAVPFVFIWGVYATFADGDFYLADEFIDLSYKVLVEELPKFVELDEFEGVEPEDISGLLATVVTRDDLRDMWRDLIEQFKAAEVVDDPVVEFKLSLAWLTAKSDVIADGLGQLLLARLPECDGQARDVVTDFECLPETLDEAQFMKHLGNVLDNEVLVDIPDELAFDINMPDGFRGSVSGFFVSVMNMFVVAISMFLLLLLALIWLVVFRPWYTVLRLEMKTICTAALILTLFLVVLMEAPGVLSGRGLLNGMDINIDILERLFALLSGAVVRRLLVYVVPVAVVSLGLWIYALLVAKKTMNVAEG